MEDNGSPIEVKNKSKTPDASPEPSELEFASDPEEISSDLPTPPSLNGTAPAAKGGKTKKFLGTLIMILVFAAAAGGGVYYWQDQEKRQLQSQIDSLQEQLDAALAKGTKTEEPAAPVNTIPEGFKEYENEEIGFKFAYPEEWGEVETGESKDNTVYFTFSKKDTAYFGGSSAKYVLPELATEPGLTGCPGFIELASEFYQACIYAGDQDNIFKVGETDTVKVEGFNTDVLLSKEKQAGLYGPYAIARFNVSDDAYYGINLVINNSTDPISNEDQASLDAIIKTIEIL